MLAEHISIDLSSFKRLPRGPGALLPPGVIKAAARCVPSLSWLARPEPRLRVTRQGECSKGLRRKRSSMYNDLSI